MNKNLWATSIIECIAMSNPTKRELDAAKKLIARENITSCDAAHLMHMIQFNPMLKLDDLDMEEFEEWIKEHYKIDIKYNQ